MSQQETTTKENQSEQITMPKTEWLRVNDELEQAQVQLQAAMVTLRRLGSLCDYQEQELNALRSHLGNGGA